MSDSAVSPTVPTMSIEIRDIGSIKPYERNPRLNDKAVDAVTRLVLARTFWKSSAGAVQH
jgi:hypothetical protein